MHNYSNPTILKHFSKDNCIEISSFSNHNLAIDTDGLVYSWGKGEHGRLGHGDISMKTVPTVIERLRSHR